MDRRDLVLNIVAVARTAMLYAVPGADLVATVVKPASVASTTFRAKPSSRAARARSRRWPLLAFVGAFLVGVRRRLRAN